MRRVIVGLPVLLGLALVIFSGTAEAASKRIRPANGVEQIKIRLGKKISTYHLATAESPAEFRVKGPVPIRVLSRCLLPDPGMTEPMVYNLRLEIDGVEIRTLRQMAGVSRKAKLYDGNPIGALQKKIAEIPAGSHTVKIYPVASGKTIALRVFRGDGKKVKTKWVSFAPENFARAVLLQAGDTEVTYYRFDAENPIETTVYGPLRMKVMSRLDFGCERGYSQAYAIKTTIDGELWHSVSFDCRASHTSTYPDVPEIAPGVGREFILDIPKGTHALRIELDCTTAEGAAVRLWIPESAVMPG